MTTIKREPTQGLSLSTRQRQLLDLLLEGKSNKEIADDLRIEAGTVKQHLFVLFKKLGVNSRAKAVIAGAQIMKAASAGQGVSKSGALQSKKEKTNPKALAKPLDGYSWRLVSAVAVSIADLGELSPSAISMRDHFLKALRSIIERLVDALDGQVTYLPGGGSVMWFGHPRAHLDDADRAVYLAQYLQSWASNYQQHHEGEKKDLTTPLIGIGVASNTEMVAEKATELFGAESFRKASILARNAKAFKMPLSDQLTKQIASMNGAWLEIKAKPNNKDVIVKDVGPIAIVGPGTASPPDTSLRWGGFPFLSNAFEGIESGLAQWIAVESWPPAAATLLTDAIGNYVSGKNYQILRLRTPGSYRRDRALASFATQIDLQFGDLVSSSERIYPTQGERIAGLISEIARVKPLAVLIYGLKALEVFKSAIGEAGIDRLASRQILIVASNLQDQGSSQISVRLLGPKPNSAPFSRVFNLQMPAIDALPEGIRIDFIAMLDNLSPTSKELMLRAANEPETPLLTILTQMHESHHKAQACIQELTSSGLIAASQGGGFEFRDIGTAQAIKHLSISIATTEAAQ